MGFKHTIIVSVVGFLDEGLLTQEDAFDEISTVSVVGFLDEGLLKIRNVNEKKFTRFSGWIFR
ncbi:TPA: hypothetical protein I8Z44_003107 [Legionella pneumophila]|nr:hypothetical protein [Legionella pneumophila]